MWSEAADCDGEKLDELLLLFFVDIAESDDDIDEDDDVDIDETDNDEVDDGATLDADVVVVAAFDVAGVGVKFSRFAVIHGCCRMSSMEILSAGRSRRHRRTRSWHS
jgi:hypothetical protein